MKFGVLRLFYDNDRTIALTNIPVIKTADGFILNLMTIMNRGEMRNMTMHTGVVKWFDNERGYGFISTGDGNDVFLHHSQVKEKGNQKDIHEGETVMFDVINDQKGPSAINVQKQ